MARNRVGSVADVLESEIAISVVGKERMGLTYRGYSIDDLAGPCILRMTCSPVLYQS
jgi:citrate synthase